MTILLENLPYDIQNYISNMLRPKELIRGNVSNSKEMKVNPFTKAPDVAKMKTLHRNFNKVPLWKNFEWTERIRKWHDENLMTMRWKYQYGTLPNKMIKLGMEDKINTEYRHQDCYVETMYGKGIGTGFVTELKIHKVIWFTVNLNNLISGTRPLPSIFGKTDPDDIRSAGEGTLNLSFDQNNNLVAAPSLNTTIPQDKRREWLIECFMDCILEYYGKKIAEKKVTPNFIKRFKELTDLPSGYELTQTDLFRMFLKELKVYSGTRPFCRCGKGPVKISYPGCEQPDNIEQLCKYY